MHRTQQLCIRRVHNTYDVPGLFSGSSGSQKTSERDKHPGGGSRAERENDVKAGDEATMERRGGRERTAIKRHYMKVNLSVDTCRLQTLRGRHSTECARVPILSVWCTMGYWGVPSNLGMPYSEVEHWRHTRGTLAVPVILL